MDRLAYRLYKSNMSSTRDHHRILNFNLFGEAGDLPDVVHCETIASRSRLNDWEFAPHRHARLHQVLLVADGGGTARIEGRTIPLSPMTLINVAVGDVHGFSFMPGTEGWVVTFAAEMLDQSLIPSEGVSAALTQSFTGRAGAGECAVMEAIFAEHGSRAYGRAQMLRALGLQLLTLAARAMVGGADLSLPALGEGEGNRAAQLLRRFDALLEAHFFDHWTVADYASALSVTPQHLSRVLREATGEPASKAIEARIIREARRNLVFTNLPVTTIAYELGYSDPAYFSRVFTRATGHSPVAFRQKAND
ncbi:AraC family transcriptional regulator [Zhengella mangrovi]|uniref:AraC family transcriptional regulator n=2 Tax=Zhengella mangrovi TaxID=1982044 RepID=A0A2G1QR00_9HYPH|nr:helix-turn-helix domain-containing protein [Zhengella mangrovi]PHP67648.1 AraC family transcriptional regulator [Zhengella mangrovi]